MTKRKSQEHRLVVVSKRREPSNEGLARVIAALVLHRLSQEPQASATDAKDSA